MKFTRAVTAVTHALGSPAAIGCAVALIAVWAPTYFIFPDADTWQLPINTTTTIITFVMVFVIQNTQNRDELAVQTKLDAQSQVIAHLGRELLPDDDDLEGLLEELVGVEDEDAARIKSQQNRVRGRG